MKIMRVIFLLNERARWILLVRFNFEGECYDDAMNSMMVSHNLHIILPQWHPKRVKCGEIEGYFRSKDGYPFH